MPASEARDKCPTYLAVLESRNPQRSPAIIYPTAEQQ